MRYKKSALDIKMIKWIFITTCCIMPEYSNAQLITSKRGVPKKANIVFILADDLGYGDVGLTDRIRLKLLFWIKWLLRVWCLQIIMQVPQYVVLLELV
jgi:hypothetical protein